MLGPFLPKPTTAGRGKREEVSIRAGGRSASGLAEVWFFFSPRDQVNRVRVRETLFAYVVVF